MTTTMLLQYLCVVSLASIAVASNQTTSGERGADCGGVSCLQDDGVCENNTFTGDLHCRCDPSTGRPQGDGALFCFKTESLTAVVRSEPYIKTFDDETYQLNLPCRYLMTKFTSRLKTTTQDPYQRVGSCECEVHSWQRKHLGKFYPHGFDVACKMARTDSYPHNVTGFSIRKYGVGENGIYSFTENGVKQYLPNGPWGCESIAVTKDGIVTKCEYDHVNNMARIHAESCGLRVDMRPFDILKGRYQDLPNGVAINIDEDHMPVLIDNSRTMVSGPRSYFGVPLYAQMENTVLTVEEFFLMRALTSDVVQNHPGVSVQCSALGDSALTCDTEDAKKRAMDQCKWMLHSQAFIKCLNPDQPNADSLLYLVTRCFDQACGTLDSCGSNSFKEDLESIPAACRTPTMRNKVHKLNFWLLGDYCYRTDL